MVDVERLDKCGVFGRDLGDGFCVGIHWRWHCNVYKYRWCSIVVCSASSKSYRRVVAWLSVENALVSSRRCDNKAESLQGVHFAVLHRPLNEVVKTAPLRVTTRARSIQRNVSELATMVCLYMLDRKREV